MSILKWIVLIGIIIVIILVLISLSSWIGWFYKVNDFTNCAKTGSPDCLTNAVMELPPVKEAQDLADSCQNPNAECYGKLGMVVVTEGVLNNK